MLALAVALSVSGSGSAQPAVATENVPDADAKAVIDALPASLGGMARSPTEGSPIAAGSARADYSPAEAMGPRVTIFVSRTVPFDWYKRRDHAREEYQGPFFKVIREGTFTAPGKPDAQTFFAEYETQLGLRQLWRLKSNDLETLVLVMVMRVQDRRLMLDAVAKQIFDGAIINDGPPATQSAPTT